MNPYNTNPYLSNVNTNDTGTTPGLSTYLKKFKNFLLKPKEGGTSTFTDYEPNAQNDYTGMAGGVKYYADPQKVASVPAGISYSTMYGPSGNVKDEYVKQVANIGKEGRNTITMKRLVLDKDMPTNGTTQTGTPKDAYVESVAKSGTPAPQTGDGVMSDPTKGMIGGTGTPVENGTKTQGNTGQEPQVSATESAFAEYLRALSPTSEEKTAYENALNTKTRGISDIELAKQSGETSAFAAGEEQRVAKNADMLTQTAMDKYNMYKDLAGSSRDIAKLKYERELAKEKNKADLTKEGFTLSQGETRYSYNPTSGRYEKTASVAPKPTTTGDGETVKKMTEAEKKNNAYSSINTLLSEGVTTQDGIPYVDPQGYITPKGSKILMQEALSEGISRKDFITNYGDRFYPGKKDKYDGYGLTPAEIKLLK